MRWPVLALVVGLLVAGVAYDRVEQVEAEAPPPPFEAAVNPVLLEPTRVSTVWYCPVGSSGGGYADHTVEVINVGSTTAVATVSLLTDTGPGPSIRLDIGAGSRRTVVLSELEAAAAAGAVVEVVGGAGVVDHIVASPHGPVRGACATAASDEWYFAGGATTRDASYFLALLNPFPEDAVFDVRFAASGRARTPAALQGAIVPARSVRVIPVTEFVARERNVATSITLRRGQLVAERLQSFDGVLGPVGSALELGAPSPSLESWHPAGRVHGGGDQHLVLFNPTETIAEVDVELQPLDPELITAFGLVPLEVSVGPGRFEVVDLVATAEQLGLPLPFDVGLHVTSVNGTPVVAERWSLAPPLDLDAIGAGGSELTEGDASTEPPPTEDEASTTAEEQASSAAPLATPVALTRVAQDGEDVEVPVEEGPAPPPPLPQATPSSGVVIDRGVVTAAPRWVLPGTPIVGGEGTMLVVVGVDETASVQVRSLLGGEASTPLATVEVAAGQRMLVPLAVAESLSDLLVRSSGDVVVVASVVDNDGVQAVLNGVPVLERPTSS